MNGQWGIFEKIGSERGIASRCEDSLSIRRFLRYDLDASIGPRKDGAWDMIHKVEYTASIVDADAGNWNKGFQGRPLFGWINLIRAMGALLESILGIFAKRRSRTDRFREMTHRITTELSNTLLHRRRAFQQSPSVCASG